MRAKVAEVACGHAYEERFTKLSELQLFILYKQALKQEKAKQDTSLEIIKGLNTAWSKKFDNLFESLQFFVNPKIYKAVKDMQEIKEFDKEINTDNFLDEWDKMMEIIPTEYIVDEGVTGKELVAEYDPEFEDMLTGWLKTSKKHNEE